MLKNVRHDVYLCIYLFLYQNFYICITYLAKKNFYKYLVSVKLTYVHSQPTSPIIHKRAEASCNLNNNGARLQISDAKISGSDNISFGSRYVKPSPMLKSTCDEIKSFYQSYRESLRDVPFRDVVNIANKISEDTGHTQKEVLTVMQKITQFANIRSVHGIVDTLNKHKISYIGNSQLVLEASKYGYMPIDSKEIHDVVHDRVGLHRTLTYLVDHKNFGVLERVGKIKTAYFLDEQKVSQLERLKEKDPNKFDKFKKLREVKFFTISGWDNGINFIDRTKSLEEETRRIINYSDKNGVSLEEAVDEPLKTRIKNLGIDPIVIKNEGMPTAQCVYRQLSPEMMSEAELFNLIDSNSAERADDIVSQLKVQSNSIKYLKDNFVIYTPEKLSESLKNIHERVLENAKRRNYTPDQILYVEPKSVKSNALITYMYKKINNISDDKFANIAEIVNHRVNPKGRLVVFIDDCTITGDSLNEAIDISKRVFGKNQPKLFACICGTQDVANSFSKKGNNEIIIDNIIGYVPTYKTRLTSARLDKAVGRPNYGEGKATCLILPYMSPDNNTEFASNLALLHNTNYRKSNPLSSRFVRNPRKRKNDKDAYIYMGTLSHDGIKNYNSRVDRVAKRAHKLAGSEPEILKDDFKTIQMKNPRKWSEYFKFSTYEEMLEEMFIPNPQ